MKPNKKMIVYLIFFLKKFSNLFLEKTVHEVLDAE